MEAIAVFLIMSEQTQFRDFPFFFVFYVTPFAERQAGNQ